MSLWDNVKKFAQPYSDDDYDDYDEDEEYDDYEEPKETTRRPRRSAAPAPAPAPEPEEEDDYGFGPMTTSTSVSTGMSGGASAVGSSGFGSPVLSVNKPSAKQEVVLFRPNSFNDITKAADDLCANKAVVVNMEGVDKAMARRVVDFLSGSVYALQGSVTKIAQSAYLFCPHNMDVIGDLESIQAEVESYI